MGERENVAHRDKLCFTSQRPYSIYAGEMRARKSHRSTPLGGSALKAGRDFFSAPGLCPAFGAQEEGARRRLSPGLWWLTFILLFTPPVQAAPISWEPAQDTTGASNLISGSPVFARNGGSNTVTVQGIPFLPLNLGSGYLANVYIATGGPGSMVSMGDTNFDALIASFTYGGGASTTITITGLTTGAQYRLQVFFNDQRATTAARVMSFGDGLGNTVDVAAGALAGSQNNDYGQFAVGSFTADAATQLLSLTANGFANCHLNAVLVTGPTNAPPAATNRGPNVVILLTDDQQFDSIRALGNPLLQTPNLDRLATNGMIFRRAYIMGGWAGAVCLPSRTMIMTGRTLWRIPGLTGNAFPANIADQTLPVAFNNAGYSTLRSGKQGNTYTAANTRFGQNIYHDVRDDIASSRFVDDALAFLDNRQAAGVSNGFLLYLGFDHPHDPRNAPPSFLDRFHASAPNPNTNTPLELLPPLPPNYLPQHPFDNGELAIRDETSVQGVGLNRDERTIRNELGKTYATIEYLDSQVGRLLARLEELNQFTNTFFVFMADNGIAIGRHGLMGKQSLYEHSLRVPLVIAGPGLTPGVSDALVYLHDVFPTLCELTGVPIPPTVDGRSLAPILRGQTNAVRDAVLGAYKTVQRAVIVGDWKLIHYPNIHRTQLFDLAADPHETNDLSRLVVHADRLKDLGARLAALQAEQADWQRLGQLGYVGANVAKGKNAWQSSTEAGDPLFAAGNAADGAGSTLSGGTQTSAEDAGAWWMVDLGEETDIEEVLVHNRAGTAKGRLRDLVIEVLDGQSNVVASSGLLNPDNVLGGGLNDFSTGPAFLAGGFTNRVPAGRFVRVTRQPAPVGSGADQNALAMEEVQVFAAPYDADADGLPDRWERSWFGSLTNASTATDTDQDGFPDQHEFLAGTNPTNPLSRLGLVSAALSAGPGGALVIPWASETGRVYTIERATNGLWSWQPLQLFIPATPPLNLFTDTPPARAFYRLRLETP